MKLNMGCGRDRREGFVNIDKERGFKPDGIVDIEEGMPFKDNSFDYVMCLQILEHIEDIYFVMSEIRRISKPDATIHIEVPYYNAKVAYTHPDHKRFFTEYTFGHLEDFEVVSIKKQRGKLVPWHVHGLKVMLKPKKS